MGESSKWRSICNQDGLRRRYISLLVPALARVDALYPPGSAQVERARAVRSAADACLVQALRTTNTHAHRHQQCVKGVDHRCVPYRRPSAASLPNPLRLRKAAAPRLGSFSCRLQSLFVRGNATSRANRASSISLRFKAARSCSVRKLAARGMEDYRRLSKRSRGNQRGREQGRNVEGSIPGENELRRLQSVLFPSKKSTDNAAGDDPGYGSNSVANPAALLSQAAHYIIALQVQVEALRSLASLNVD